MEHPTHTCKEKKKKNHKATRLWEHSTEIKWYVNDNYTNMMLLVHIMFSNLMQWITCKAVREILIH